MTITADSIGNPTSFYDGYAYTMEWEHGRQLKSVTYGNVTTRYQYNADGIRIKKTLSNGTWHEFHVMGGTIIGETRYNANGSVSLWMRYNMDADGSIYGISTWYPGDTSWTDYYFVKNLQGDVIQVRQASTNTVVASYTYDAWGNVLSESGTLAHINRFRYRGYYYDEESALYYLQSRYYDPALGRFINADSFASTGQGVLGNNMFAYCGNNPSNRYDPTGYAFSDIFAVCFGGAGAPDVDVLTDGSPGSESLAEYVQNYIIPDNAVATSINVTQNANRYYHVNASTCVGTVATCAGGAILGATKVGAWAIGAFPACVPYVAPALAWSGPIGDAITAVGVAAIVIGSQTALPDGSYEEYSVVASWTTVTHPIGFPNVSIYTTHSLTARYVWNYGNPDIPPYWYLLDYMYDSSSRTYGY